MTKIYLLIQEAMVILNFFDKQVEFNVPENIKYKKNELLISNYEVQNNNFNNIKLRPYEARVYMLK